DHAIVTDDCYGGVYRIFTRIMSGYGIETTFLDLRDLVDVEDAFRPETKMVWMESPTNPLMKVVDLKELAVISKAHDSISVCDNTFGSPALQNPLGLGVDLVVHSTTKYIGGHADLLGGAIVTNREDLYEKLRFAQNALGAVPSPFDCWLTLRGIKTLAVRMERHCDNAEAMARFLAGHKGVSNVHYPGLPEDPGHRVAKKQMRRFGGMLSFEMRDAAKVVGREQSFTHTPGADEGRRPRILEDHTGRSRGDGEEDHGARIHQASRSGFEIVRDATEEDPVQSEDRNEGPAEVRKGGHVHDEDPGVRRRQRVVLDRKDDHGRQDHDERNHERTPGNHRVVVSR